MSDLVVRNKHTLPTRVVECLDSVIGYCWGPEERDYYQNCSYHPEDNQRDGHVFQALRTLNAWLDAPAGTPPEDPGDDLGWLASEKQEDEA